MKRIALLTATLALGASCVATSRPAGAQATSVIVPRKADPNQKIAFSFQQADIDDVLRFLADATGKIVFKDPAVSTSVTIRNPNQITVAEAIRLVTTILSFRGFSMIETEDALIVTTTMVARTRQVTPVTTGKDMAGIPRG